MVKWSWRQTLIDRALMKNRCCAGFTKGFCTYIYSQTKTTYWGTGRLNTMYWTFNILCKEAFFMDKSDTKEKQSSSFISKVRESWYQNFGENSLYGQAEQKVPVLEIVPTCSTAMDFWKDAFTETQRCTSCRSHQHPQQNKDIINTLSTILNKGISFPMSKTDLQLPFLFSGEK